MTMLPRARHRPRARLAAACGLLALALAASGCLSREAVIRNHLRDAGLSAPMAECMADPLARELSNDQLRKLAGLASSVKGDPRNMTYGEILRTLGTLGDLHLTQIALRTATACALRP